MKTKTILIGTGVAVVAVGAAWYFLGRGKRVGPYIVKALSKSPPVPTGMSLVEAEAQELGKNDAGALGAFDTVYAGKYPDTARAYYIFADGGYGPAQVDRGTFFFIDGMSWVRVKKA